MTTTAAAATPNAAPTIKPRRARVPSSSSSISSASSAPTSATVPSHLTTTPSLTSNNTKFASMVRKHHRGAANASLASKLASRPLSPLLVLAVLAFGLIHIVYQLSLWAAQLSTIMQRTAAPRRSRTDPSSTGYAKVPRHLAAIFSPTQPSNWRLLVSTCLSRSGPQLYYGSHWTELQQQRQRAFKQKTAMDLCELVRLSCGVGIETLSVYTREPMQSEELLAAQRQLERMGFVVQGGPGEASPSMAPHARHLSCSSSASSDDGEISTQASGSSRSEDETLASSNTSVIGDAVDEAAQAHGKRAAKVVRLITTGTQRMQRHRNALQRLAETQAQAQTQTQTQTQNQQDKGCIDVILLSHDDGKLEMARSASVWATQMGRVFLQRLLALAPSPREASAATEGGEEKETARDCRKKMVAGMTVGEVNAYLLQQGTIDEPDFLVVVGGQARVQTLHGFPPWPIRLTELFFEANPSTWRVYSCDDFDRALRGFEKSQHRYGR
ncbi:hypothetical protein ACQY0O_007682 [Thecaphora frezii]